MPVYRNADEKPHKGMYNLKEASELTGYSVKALRDAIAKKALFATKQQWRYGVTIRRAYFISATELMRFVGWKSTNAIRRHA